VSVSRFIKAMHPKTAIPPTRDAVKRILERGWWGQVKINGHRAQVHVPADEALDVVVYTRQGGAHKKALPPALAAELRRLFTPTDGWNVVDAEWDKPEDKLYVFDMLKFNGRVLDTMTFQDRFALLPRVYSSPSIETLAIVRSLDKCLEILAMNESRIEGMVFKSPTTEGFQDSGIVRCIAPAHAR
jgi:ATP-dependent DNA ligase